MELTKLVGAAVAVLSLSMPAWAEDVKFINLTTSTSGGTFYPAGIALANIISEKAGIRASAISSAGSVENISLLRNQEVNMAFLQIDVAQNAIAGTGPFEGDAFDEMVMLTPLFSSVDHILVADGVDVDSLASLEGKRFAAGRPGSGTLLSTQAVLGSAGLTLDDIQTEYLGQSEAIAALQNGIIDGTLVSAGIPATSVTEAMTVAGDKLSIYSMSEQELAQALETINWKVAFTIPSGTYPGQESEIETTAHMSLLVVPEDFPESSAREVLDVLYSSLDELSGMHAIYKSLSLERATKAFEQIKIKKHPAAEAFFEGQ